MPAYSRPGLPSPAISVLMEREEARTVSLTTVTVEPGEAAARVEMGYEPGPRFREILTAVEDAQLEGSLSSREAALEFVRQKFAADGR